MLDVIVAMRALEGPGRDIDDARLIKMQASADRGPDEAAAASKIASDALKEGVTDVRVMACFFYGVFLEQGPASLATVLPLLRSAVTEKWHALRPDERKERVVDSALSWLFKSLANIIEFHEIRRDSVFAAWQKTVGRPSLEASHDLRAALAGAISGNTKFEAPLSALEACIRSQLNRPLPPPHEEEAPPAAPPPREVARPEPAEPLDRAAPQPLDKAPSPAPRPPPALADAREPAMVEVSPAFRAFQQRLKVFQALTSGGEMLKAAVVAADIRRTMESFDPKVYFPKLLSPYLQDLSAHIDQIAPYWDESKSRSWKALEELYLVDLDAFLAS